MCICRPPTGGTSPCHITRSQRRITNCYWIGSNCVCRSSRYQESRTRQISDALPQRHLVVPTFSYGDGRLSVGFRPVIGLSISASVEPVTRQVRFDEQSPADEPMGLGTGVTAAQAFNEKRTLNLYQWRQGAKAKYRRGPSLYVTAHRVQGTARHLAIEYVPEAGDTKTLSAGLDAGLLVSEPDHPSDNASGNNYTVPVIVPPKGITVEAYFDLLQAADKNYCDCIDYNLFPALGDSYNSNSYVRGILEATGGSTTVDFYDYYGGTKPLPERYFETR